QVGRRRPEALREIGKVNEDPVFVTIEPVQQSDRLALKLRRHADDRNRRFARTRIRILEQVRQGIVDLVIVIVVVEIVRLGLAGRHARPAWRTLPLLSRAGAGRPAGSNIRRGLRRRLWRSPRGTGTARARRRFGENGFYRRPGEQQIRWRNDLSGL